MPDAPSLRETLEAAMQQDAAPVEAEVEAPVEVEAAPEPSPEPEQTAADRARDEKGRFAPKAAEKAEAAPEGAKKPDAAPKAGAAAQAKAGVEAAAPAPAPAVEQPAPIKAPQSWKPQMRELASKLPAEFRPLLEEVNRREVETARVLQETTQARRLAEQVQQTIAPFEGIARANGVDAMTFAGQVLQTAAALQMGTPQQKAATVAQLIQGFGVDIEALASALDGQAPRGGAQAQPQVNVQAEVERVIQARMQQAQAQKAETDIRAFLGTQPEFIQDVGGDMVAIFDSAHRQGRNVTPQEAYDRACWMNPDVRDILEKRKAVEAAKAQAPSLAKSKAAASSIKAAPAEPVKGKQGERSLREELEAAMSSRT